MKNEEIKTNIEAEIEQLKAKPENAPLTLDEVKELKEGDVVWIKQEVYLTSQKEIQPVEFYTAMKKQWLFLMIGDFERHGKLYDELNETYFVYRNKPEDEPLTSYDKSKRQHEICRQVRKNIYPTGKSESIKIVSIKAAPLGEIYQRVGADIAKYINQHGRPPEKIFVSALLLSVIQNELAPWLKDKTIVTFMGVPVEAYLKDTTALEFYICGERHVIKFGEE